MERIEIDFNFTDRFSPLQKRLCRQPEVKPYALPVVFVDLLRQAAEPNNNALLFKAFGKRSFVRKALISVVVFAGVFVNMLYKADSGSLLLVDSL